VYRAPSLAGAKIYLGKTSGPPYNDRTALPGKTYCYWVKAANTFGTSEFSLPDEGYRSTRMPSPPESLLASDGTYADKVEVTWSPSEKAITYTVYRSTSRWGWKTILSSTSDTIYNDTTAKPGKTYYYWVKASNSVGSSRFSSFDTGYRP
jgi:fibronectin type 3 domain-containing protein